MRKPFVVASVAALTLSGCATGSPGENPSISTATTTTAVDESPTATLTPTPIPTPTPDPAYVTYSCSIEDDYQDFLDVHSIWATKAAIDHCEVEFVEGYENDPRTPLEQKALTTAYGPAAEPDSIRFLYGICATTTGIPIDDIVSGEQAKEASGAILLCPDHPKMVSIKKSIAKGFAQAKLDAAIEADRKNGKFLSAGSYLVGKEAVPGTWQSQGEKVSECYWEISDAAGNIMDNNYISVAPQFSIVIPANAAGVTIRGCSFRWVGP